LLIYESLWKRRFGKAKLNGQAILVDDEWTDIVGILPPTFQFLDWRFDAIRALPPFSSRSAEANQKFRYLMVLERLRPGGSASLIDPAIAQRSGD